MKNIDIKSMPPASRKDFSISHITDMALNTILMCSEVGSDFSEVSIAVAKEILKRNNLERI